MEQPGRLLSLFRELLSSSHDINHPDPTLTKLIHGLTGSDLVKLLKYVRDWNTSAKNADVAQGVLGVVVRVWDVERFLHAFSGDELGMSATDFDLSTGVASKDGGAGSLKELLDALIPYTERHLTRMERLVKESYVVDYVLGEMDGGVFGGVDDDDDDDDSMVIDVK